MNPFENLNTELQVQFQSAIDTLGKDFWGHSSLGNSETGEFLCWSSFGYEHAGWYQVSVYSKVGDTLNWMWCVTGTAIIDANKINWEKVKESPSPEPEMDEYQIRSLPGYMEKR